MLNLNFNLYHYILVFFHLETLLPKTKSILQASAGLHIAYEYKY